MPCPFQLLRQKPTPGSFICRGCRSRLPPCAFPRHRLYSSSIPSPNLPPPPRSGFAHLRNRRLISLRGPDSSHYLQGVITANISPSTRRSTGFYAAFLNAHGRVLNDVFIYPDQAANRDAWLIEVDASEAERLYKHIKRYKLRAKFDVRLIDESEMGVWSIWQKKDGKAYPDGSTSWTAHTIGEPDRHASHEIGCVDSRAPGMGRRLILPGSKKPEVQDDMEETTEEAYRIRRYLKGVAEGQGEILRESALPQESNIDFMGGIDYRKGCYVGQELTIRTHHTGVIRKRILPLMIYGLEDEIPKTPEYNPSVVLDSPPAETDIARFNKKGRSAGKWLAGVGNIGLGLCRVEIITDTVVQGEAGSYKDGDEFKLEWAGEDGSTKMVKVKAFVPPWHLTR
jgi:folate-binding protein YgfZ